MINIGRMSDIKYDEKIFKCQSTNSDHLHLENANPISIEDMPTRSPHNYGTHVVDDIMHSYSEHSPVYAQTSITHKMELEMTCHYRKPNNFYVSLIPLVNTVS